MKLTRYSPWRDLRDLEERMNRIFGERLPRTYREGGFTGEGEPAVDVYETDKGFVLKADLPELDEKDVHVSVEGNMLTISGERKRDAEFKEGSYHCTERFYGSFSRSFALPETVDRERIKATFKGGVMKLEIPKREEVKPREIPIEVEK